VAASKKSTAKKIERFHVVAGSDEGQVRSAAHELFHELAENPDDEFANETIDGAAENSEAAFQICRKTSEALRTLPFFGAKVVWLRNATILSDGVTGNAERTQEGLQLLRETLEAGLPEGIVFLLSASNPDKRRSFWKFIQSSADLRFYEKIDMGKPGWEEQVAGMVLRQAKEMGLSFASGALELFVMLVGVDSGRIANELEKLDLYLGKKRREVTENDVREMVPLGSAGIVFEIGNAIKQGNAARAIELIDKQIAMSEKGASTAAIGIIRASIIPTVRNLFMAAVLLDGQNLPFHNYSVFKTSLEKMPEKETKWLPRSKKTGAINAYPIFLAAKQASRFSLAHLREALEACARADRDLVSTTRDPRLVLHHLIVSLALPTKKKSHPRGGKAA
jgi:DNA polymerase-3 subunit delta